MTTGPTPSPDAPVSAAPWLYSVKQFLELANISHAHFYRLLAAGKGPSILKLGDKTMIVADDALAWIKQLKDAARSTKLTPRGKFGKRTPTLDDVLSGRA
jgi:predicted DNA-binding transcriptional regulator AlpA